jgi:protein-disulfide isomerase
MARMEKNMESDEVRETLDESAKLARALGIDGTPSYVMGENVVVGAVGPVCGTGCNSRDGKSALSFFAR